MSYNPYTQRVADLAAHIKRLDRDRVEVGAQMTAYEGFNLEEQHQCKLDVSRKIESETSKLHVDVKEAKHAKAAHAEALGQDALKIRYFLSSRHAVAKQVLSERKKAVILTSNTVSNRTKLVESLAKQHAEISSGITTYQTTDILQLQARHKAIQVELEMSNNQLIHLRVKKSKIDGLIHAQVESLREYERRCNGYREDILQAECYENDLNRAANGFERREIHKSCEAALGNGKPTVVISNRKSLLAGDVSTIQKLDQAIKLAVKRADVDIRSMVLDGSNLCYQRGNELVGLKILLALVPELLKRFSVSIVFDPGIRGILKMTNSEIRDQFPGAEVHVMKTKTTADETILNAAEFDPRSYVISNDLFKDYPQKRAVSEQRVLGFTTLNNTLSIESVHINVPLSNEQKKESYNDH